MTTSKIQGIVKKVGPVWIRIDTELEAGASEARFLPMEILKSGLKLVKYDKVEIEISIDVGYISYKVAKI